MIYPPLSSLLSKVDSRYTLVVATAKRARPTHCRPLKRIELENATRSGSAGFSFLTMVCSLMLRLVSLITAPSPYPSGVKIGNR